MHDASFTQIVMPMHVNGAMRLFGGQLMAWIDIVGAVAARRHAGMEVTTVSVDNLDFLSGAQLNDTVVLKAYITWTGRTSMEVRVDTYVEPLCGPLELVNRAYIVYVAVNAQGKPVTVPPFIPATPEQQAEWQQAKERKALRAARKTPRQGG